jgi:chromosome segregation ATPase
MSDELEARLKTVQKDLAQVQREVNELKEQVGAPDPVVAKLAEKVAEQLHELSERKDAFAELEGELIKLRLEAAQVQGAVDEPA